MHYISTRGQSAPLSFTDAGLGGLATDGGLLVPNRLPDVSGGLSELATLSYPDLAFRLFTPFVCDIPPGDLRGLVQRAYASFHHPETAPCVRVGPRHILELFHGPTLAFKDMAMQFLAQFFEYSLEQRQEQLNILGSTSGDTGSAAIHGVRGKSRIRIFMMHPDGRTSPLQALQMTSVTDANVFNLAIRGTFDDCQGIMKSLFADLPFKTRYQLGAVNSVNWIRVMAQIVYYFYAGLRVMRDSGSERIQFAVPTGNFGNILAGYYAACMGLPVSRLILATNENDILSRFINTGLYESGRVAHTLSPSMDIQVASNFERFLYALLDHNADAVRDTMARFSREGRIDLSNRLDHPVLALFRAGRADSADTLRCIRETYAATGTILDPHTAVGVSVGDALRNADPLICLATAHPAKFPDALREAIGIEPTHPLLDALKNAPTRCDTLPSVSAAVRAYLEEKLAAACPG
jgi:threonine synthase